MAHNQNPNYTALYVALAFFTLWGLLYYALEGNEDKPNNYPQEEQRTPQRHQVNKPNQLHFQNVRPIEPVMQQRVYEETPEDAYNEGYENGYEQGKTDGVHGYSHGYGYDDSNDYYDYYAKRYEEGYEEGYDEGYSLGQSSYEENQEDIEND